MARDLWNLLILMVSMLALLGGLHLLKKRKALSPEVSRKLMHVALGLAMLDCMFLFRSLWPVAVFAASTIAVLLVVKWHPRAGELGTVVGGVKRRTAGEFYFPVAAFLLFAITEGDPILFGVPILTLTFADAIAALIGVEFGRLRYATAEGSKSFEGSVAFFGTAFLTTYVPLGVFTRVGQSSALLIGLIFGLIVMVLEAVSIHGTDNVFIPFGGYLLLRTFLEERVVSLLLVAAVLVSLFMVVLLLRRHRTLNDTGMLAVVLVAFVIWVVGGWRWLVPPLILLATYTVIWPRRKLVRDRPHDGGVVGAVAGPGLFWLLLSVVFSRTAFYHLFALSFAAHLCFFGLRWFRDLRPNVPWHRAATQSAAVAWVMIFGAHAAVGMNDPLMPAVVGASLVFLLVGAAAFPKVIPAGIDAHPNPFPWTRQAFLALATSALGATVILSLPA